MEDIWNLPCLGSFFAYLTHSWGVILVMLASGLYEDHWLLKLPFDFFLDYWPRMTLNKLDKIFFCKTCVKTKWNFNLPHRDHPPAWKLKRWTTLPDVYSRYHQTFLHMIEKFHRFYESIFSMGRNVRKFSRTYKYRN